MSSNKVDDLGSYGPGWFYNVFNISIEFENKVRVIDDGEIFSIPWFSFTGEKILLNNKEEKVIKGRIQLNTFNNTREVWHGGIQVIFYFYLS